MVGFAIGYPGYLSSLGGKRAERPITYKTWVIPVSALRIGTLPPHVKTGVAYACTLLLPIKYH